MKFSIVERFTSANRWVGFGVVGILSVSLIAAGVFLSVGSGDEPSEGDDPGGMDEAPVALGADGLPLLPDATLIAEIVEATIAAMPTATPLPTPDVAATLQAELASNRQEVQPVVLMNPLDSRAPRSPFLTPEELDYFREFGPRLWVYTQVWLHLQRVISADIGEWTVADLRHDLGMAQVLLDTSPERPLLHSGDSVRPVVRAYADSLESGFSGVRSGVARLVDAEAILASGSLGNTEREELLRVVRDIEEALGAFDEAMSTYGCSVCGELFRRDRS